MTHAEPSLRSPAVAGSFYPGHPLQLRTAVERFLVREKEPRRVLALVVPHAGYIYSGATAGRGYAASILPKRLFLLCPNHTGVGLPLACWESGAWRTPLGDARVDAEMARALLEACPAVKADHRAHLREHAAEVHLPFLQVYLEEFSFVPVAVMTHDLPTLEEFGRGMARVLAQMGEEGAIVVSSDMNHYEDARTNRRKDDLALGALLALDGPGLHRVCTEQRITMCGVAPAVAAAAAARELGAEETDLVDYTHSGQVTGDDSEVVSYAAVRVFRPGRTE